MTLNPCPSCGTAVSSNAEWCPKCGHAFHATTKRKTAIGCVLALLCFAAFGWCFSAGSGL